MSQGSDISSADGVDHLDEAISRHPNLYLLNVVLAWSKRDEFVAVVKDLSIHVQGASDFLVGPSDVVRFGYGDLIEIVQACGRTSLILSSLVVGVSFDRKEGRTNPSVRPQRPEALGTCTCREQDA